jgi:hypothetical protein
MRQTVILVYQTEEEFNNKFAGEYYKLDHEMTKIGATRMEEIPIQKAHGHYKGVIAFLDYNNPNFVME